MAIARVSAASLDWILFGAGAEPAWVKAMHRADARARGRARRAAEAA